MSPEQISDKPNQKWPSFFEWVAERRPISIIVVASMIILASGSAFFYLRAQSPVPHIVTETEDATLEGEAEVTADVVASGSEAVAFTEPDTPPGGGGGTGGGNSCSVSDAWAPGGPDPWGGCWPGPNNTGVPAGTSLSAYTGSCTITAVNTVIDSRTVNCSPLTVRAANVTITKSRLNGGVNIESAYCGSASFTISDSHVDIPAEVSGNSGSTGILRCNFHASRVNVTGGRRSIYCVSNCTIENSWVHEHGVDPNAEAHFSGIRMEQGGTIRHNSITCEATRSGPGSGCSAGLTGYPDFAPVTNNLIERNLFYRGAAGGSTMCAYGGATANKPFSNDPANATHIRFISNRFVRGSNGHCGNLGTILHFSAGRTGNVWTDNLFNNGSAVNP